MNQENVARQLEHLSGQPDMYGDVTLLNRAIASFNATAQDLQQSYRLLREQVRHLNRELEEKNRQLEVNLAERERVKNFLSSILESLPTGVLVMSPEGDVLMCNNAVEKITGVRPDLLAPDEQQRWMERLGALEAGAAGRRQDKSYEIEFESKSAGLRDLKVLRTPVIGNDGTCIGVLHILQDQTRLKKLEMQSERDERLKAMGEMAIQIAHEVRNPLGSIELLASILRSELDEQQDLRTMANRIVTEVKSLDNTISNLLLFTRPQKPQLHQVDLADFMFEFVEFVRPVVSKSGIDIRCSCSPVPALINGDGDLLKQVFLNLTLNALQAMPDGGSIAVAIQCHQDEADEDRRWVEVSFSDTGVGISPHELNKIFNPFYTSKEKGTGLGLAIVHNIIECHDATIAVRSKPGGGTSFIISIPAAAGGYTATGVSQ